MLKILSAIVLLISGLVAYWFFRPEIYLFSLIQIKNPDPVIVANNIFLLFLKNHFADTLWCIAAFQIATVLQSGKCPRIYSNSLLMLPFLSEILQAAGLIQGTFDWVDLCIYSTVFVLFFYKEVFRMHKITKHFAGILAISIFTAALVGSGPPRRTYVYETGTFTLEQKKDEIFTKPSLARILRTSKNPAIVLRVPNPGKDVTEQQQQVKTSLYTTIEKEFAKAGYIVRDRALFAKVLDQENLDYLKIGQLTKTDLILELVSYNKVQYKTKIYKDEAGIEKTAAKDIIFTGRSIEFKVTSVEENDLVGSYVFNYTPCTTGCTHRFSLSRASTLKAPENIPKSVFKSWASRLLKELARDR